MKIIIFFLLLIAPVICGGTPFLSYPWIQSVEVKFIDKGISNPQPIAQVSGTWLALDF